MLQSVSLRIVEDPGVIDPRIRELIDIRVLLWGMTHYSEGALLWVTVGSTLGLG